MRAGVALLGLLLVGPLQAQRAGDILIASGPDLIRVAPTGALLTIYAGSPATTIVDVEPAFGGQGWVVAQHAGYWSDILHVVGGVATTVQRVGTIAPIELMPRADGTIDYARIGPGACHTLCEQPWPSGNPRIIAPLCHFQHLVPFALAEDPRNGDRLVADFLGSDTLLYRVSRAATVTTMTVPLALPLLTLRAGLHVDPSDGQMVLVGGDRFATFGPAGPTRTGPLPMQGSVPATAIDADPFAGAFVVAQYDTLYRFSVATGQAQTIHKHGGWIEAVHVVGSRAFDALSAPRAGTAYRVGLTMLGEGGRPYIAAASLAMRPAIVAQNRRIPLRADGLLAYSLTPNPVFVGFTGWLDPTGHSMLTVNLPVGAAGLRVFLAAITIGSGRVRSITEAFGFTVE